MEFFFVEMGSKLKDFPFEVLFNGLFSILWVWFQYLVKYMYDVYILTMNKDVFFFNKKNVFVTVIRKM